MNNFAKKKCVPCREGMPPLTEEEIKKHISEINDWHVIANHHIEKKFTFPDFKATLAFVNKVGELAEIENHHPNPHYSPQNKHVFHN